MQSSIAIETYPVVRCIFIKSFISAYGTKELKTFVSSCWELNFQQIERQSSPLPDLRYTYKKTNHTSNKYNSEISLFKN